VVISGQYLASKFHLRYYNQLSNIGISKDSLVEVPQTLSGYMSKRMMVGICCALEIA
jgi:ABC-type dipeptide/oligopeptide/nickel transport system ATPase component